MGFTPPVVQTPRHDIPRGADEEYAISVAT